MTRNFKGKTALVTGASRGIGKAIAKRLAEHGFNLVIVARSEDELSEVAQLCRNLGVNCDPLALDLSQENSPERVISFIKEKYSTLEVMVNNAATQGGGTLDKADLQRWDRCLDLNFRSAVHLCTLGLPLMNKSGWGAIINISSLSAHRPSGNAAMYSATKHALNGFSHSIFEDIRETGIKVVALCPGFVATDFVSKYKLIEEKMIQPEDLADAVTYILNCSDTVCPNEIIFRPQRSPYPQR